MWLDYNFVVYYDKYETDLQGALMCLITILLLVCWYIVTKWSQSGVLSHYLNICKKVVNSVFTASNNLRPHMN